MPTTLQDDEDQRISDDDLRDILGIDPDEEAAMETAATEGAAEDNASSLTPDQLAKKEADPDSGSGKETPDDSLESRFGNMFKDAREKDNFYKGKGGGGSKGSFFKKKGVIGAMGGAGVVVAIGSVFMFSFMHTFQMDHFFKNTEAKTSKRLSASLDTRNKSLMRAYMRMRVTEYEGNTEGKNLFFKGDKITDNANPIKDWYATMRKNKFEENVLNKQGITFTSMVDGDGNINVAKITGRDSVDPKLIAKYDLTTIDSKNFAQRLSAIPDDDLEKIFTIDKFDTHKAARKSVKQAVNTEVPWYRVFKRRHVRNDEQSVSGIKSWRLFENKRDKLAKDVQARKNQLYGKIIDTYFSRNPNTANLLKCIFANGSCAKTTDVADKENTIKSTGNGENLDENKQDAPDDEGKQAQGELKKAENTIADDIGDETGKIVSNAVEGDIDKELSQEAAKSLEGKTLGSRIMTGLIAKITGQEISEVAQSAIPYNPGTVWTIAKWVAKMDKLLGSNGSSADKSKLSMMVKNAKRAQLIGLFAAMSIGNDQIKSGELLNDQLNDYFKSMAGMGNSEGWLEVTGRSAGTSAADVAAKKAYCDKEPSQRTYTEFAWYCDDQNPSNGGNAQKISEMYKSSIGPIAGPIAAPINAIQENPVFSSVANFLPNVISKITEPLTNYAAGTDVGKNLSAQLAGLMMKFVGFLGGGPMFDGSAPGIGNMIAAGGAFQAEASTRMSGGAASTVTSLNYTNQLASQYDKEQKNSESLYDRYASLDSRDSFASTTLFAVSNKPLTQQVGSFFTSIGDMPMIFGNMLSGRAFAQSSSNASDVSDWAGAEKFDVPQQCQDLDPLDPDYLAKSSNVKDVLGLDPKELGWDVMKDSGKFFEKVYEKSQDENVTKSIYNCAIFDRRVRGNIGALSGYNDDGGYSPEGGSNNTANTGTNGTTASNANLYWVGDSYTVGAKSAGLDSKLGTNGWKVTSNGLVSRHMTGEPPSPGGIQQMDQDKAVMSNAGVVVVALGTNDIGASADAFNTSLKTTYDKVKANAPNAKIYWVNYFLKSVADNGKSKSDLLAQFAGSNGITVIDYASIAAPLPYTSDGIHPQNYGPLVDKAVETIGKAPSS